jgi:hypothetical protein
VPDGDSRDVTDFQLPSLRALRAEGRCWEGAGLCCTPFDAVTVVSAGLKTDGTIGGAEPDDTDVGCKGLVEPARLGSGGAIGNTGGE